MLDKSSEDRLHLNNKNKKVPFLFCIVFDLHYLCTHQFKRIYMKYYEINFKISADSTIIDDVKAVIAAMTGEAGLETFEDTDEGMKGYAQTTLLDRQALDEALAMLPFEGAKVTYTIEDAEDKDWNEQWENEGFEPIAIGSKLVVHDGRHLPDKAFDISIEIDAKLAFGTGSHETTRMILSMLSTMDLKGKRVLDCGCGTGILSIAALKMGAKEAVGYDIDEWSADNARHNAIINMVDDRFTSLLGDASVIDNIEGNFDVVVANINRNILLNDMPKFVKKMNSNGTLILSGFYCDDIPLLEAKAKEYGLSLAEQKNDGEWACIKVKK